VSAQWVMVWRDAKGERHETAQDIPMFAGPGGWAVEQRVLATLYVAEWLCGVKVADRVSCNEGLGLR
jgi:hypothetical protein